MVAHKILLYPNQETQEFLQRQFEYARRDYNRQLEIIIRGIQGGSVDLFNLKKSMDLVCTYARKHPDFYDRPNYHYPDIIGWNKRRVLAAAEDYLANPLRGPKYLRHSKFRPCFRLTSSPLDPQRFVASEDHHLLLGGMHRIRMAEPLRFQTQPIACEISYRNGRYFASFLFSENLKPYLKTGRSAGVTVGCSDLAVAMDDAGRELHWNIDQASRTRRHKKIQHLEKLLANKKKGSARWKKTKDKLDGLMRKEEDTVKNFVEQTSHTLARDYDLIALDDPGVQNALAQNAYAKTYLQQPFSILSTRILRKAKTRGKKVVFMKEGRAISQICSQCGERNREIRSLSNRRWTCPNCGKVHNSDLEGAMRLLKEAKRQNIHH